MADLKRLAAYSVAPLLLAACAARLPYEVAPPRSGGGTIAEEAQGLSGQYVTSENRSVDMSTLNDKPAVLIFSQDTCTTCAREADTLRGLLAHPDRAPSRIHLTTILVGAITDDAVDWKSEHQVPWEVAIDPDSSLFKQYCQVLTVPCVIVALPGRGIVLRKNGFVSLSEMTALTGPWEDP